VGFAAGAGAAAVLFLLGLFAPSAIARSDAGGFAELHLA
jgi:hypothetical protein